MDHAADGNEKWHLLTHSFTNICRYCVMCVKWHLAQQNPINLSFFHHKFCSAESPVGAEGKMFCGCHGWLEEPLMSLINSPAYPDSRWTPPAQFPKGRGQDRIHWFWEEMKCSRFSDSQALTAQIGFSFPWLFYSREPRCPKWSYSHDFIFRQCWHLAGILGLESKKKKKKGDVVPFFLLNLLQDTALVPWTLHQ